MTDGRRQADGADPHVDGTDGTTAGDSLRRRRVRLLCAVGLAWLGGVAAWYYLGTLLALWTSLTH